MKITLAIGLFLAAVGLQACEHAALEFGERMDRSGSVPPPTTVAAPGEPSFSVRVLTRTKRREGDPVPFVYVAAGASRFSDAPGEALAEGYTDREGVVTLELPWSAVEDLVGDSRARLWVGPRQLGYRESRSMRFLPERRADGGESVDMILVPLRGATARGSFFDADGRLSRGKVRAERQREDGGWGRLLGATLAGDGFFELHLARSGRYRLIAEVPDGNAPGSGFLGPLELDLDQPPQDLVIRLRGPGSLRGKVIDEEGRAVAGVRILAIVERADVWPGTGSVPDEVRTKFESEAAGLHRCFGTTDGEGRFEFRGLRDDRFHVWAMSVDGDKFSHLLTQVSVPSDGSELVLQFDRPHLVVRVREGDQLVPVERIERSVLGGFLDSWPEKPSVLVRRAPGSPIFHEARHWMNVSETLASGELIFDLLPGIEWLVTMLAPGQRARIERVSLTPDSGRRELTFELGEPTPTGTLRVEVTDPEGTRLLDEVSVQVLDPETDAYLVGRHWFHEGEEDWPVEFDLPHGEYRLVVLSEPTYDGHHGILLRRREYGECRALATVRAGETTALTARLSVASYLDLELAGQVSAADRAFVARRLEGINLDSESRELRARSAHVLLRPSRGYAIGVEFARRAFEGSSAYGTHTFETLPLGTRATSEALPPGEYRLELRLPGGRELSREVILLPGETLPLRFDFGSE